jgi:hypothetical protein
MMLRAKTGRELTQQMKVQGLRGAVKTINRGA